MLVGVHDITSPKYLSVFHYYLATDWQLGIITQIIPLRTLSSSFGKGDTQNSNLRLRRNGYADHRTTADIVSIPFKKIIYGTRQLFLHQSLLGLLSGMTILKFLGCLLILFQVCVADEDVDWRRPVWNIAHMVNAIYQIDYYLDMGANSVEFDIAFDNNGNARFTFHGVPCDCFRSCVRYEKIEDYLEYMRQLTAPGDPKFQEKLVLLFMDVKVKGLSSRARTNAGYSLAQKLVRHYWKNGTSDARASILLSIPSIDHMETVRGFRRGLQEAGLAHYINKIGVDFSGNEDLNMIRSALRSTNISERIWQGDGITNCLPRGTGRLREALSRRDQLGLTFINKVYWWTVDKMSTMRATLRLGVDAMITNYPERLVSVLEENEFSRTLRMATIDDNPWSKHLRRTAALYALDESPTARGGKMLSSDKEDDELLYNC